ncbi:MAG: heparinase II/III-family protein [Planctomycetes bacterium]|nr:heparinase II/III-family protein [Planctomycetota bacterium]
MRLFSQIALIILLALSTTIVSCGGGGGGSSSGGEGPGSPPGSNKGRGGGGGGASTASVVTWAQEGGRLSLTVDTAGGEVTLVATEGNQSDSVNIRRSGASEHSFRIPRRGTPLTTRTMKVEAFDTNGQLLTMREFDVIEPMDLPATNSMLALNLADIADLQSRVSVEVRARNVLGTMTDRTDAQLQEALHVPTTKGLDGVGYRCPHHGNALIAIDDEHHQCPIDGHVFGPDNTDSTVYSAILGAYNSKIHGEVSEQAFEMAVSWVVNEDIESAQRAADILMTYADLYLSYPLNDKKGRTDSRQTSRVLSQSLDEARWLINLARTMDLLRGSGVLTGEQEDKIREQLLRPSAELLAGKREAYGYHNIQCWHNSAVFLAALLVEDFEMAEEALNAPYGLMDQLAFAQASDYLWFEGSFGYHFFAVRGMLPQMLAMRRGDVAADKAPLREMMLTPLEALQPDGSFPMLNDSSYKSLTTNAADLYEMAVALFNNDEAVAAPLVNYGRGNTVEGIIYGLKDVRAGGWNEPDSENLEVSGLATLRAGSLATQTMALVDYGPHGGDHGHYDKLGLSAWIGGSPLIRESGHIGYTDPWYRGWYQRTLAHSTVVRDGLDQDAITASTDLLRFTRSLGSTLLEVRTDQAYPGSTMQRLTTTTANGRIVDMFEVTGSNEHTYDYVLHFEGTSTVSLSMTPTADDLGYGGAYGFLSNMSEATTDQDFEVTIQTDAGPSTVRVLGAPGTTVYFGEAIGFPSNRAHPVLLLRRTTSSTVFATVMTEGAGLPEGMSIAHVPNSREVTIEEPEVGAPTTISMQ